MVRQAGAHATSLVDNSGIPRKLRDDAILEAVCQLQFKTADLPELVIGRLSLETKWKNFTPHRLPFADIPVPVRSADPNLKTQATFELRNADASRIVRLNECVMSYHLVGVNKYCGWTKFKPEIAETVGAIFERLQKPEINRITLRYINAIHPDRHFINSVHDLELEVRVGGSKVAGSLNLNYVEGTGTNYITTTRIAHPEFVQGNLPERIVAVVDVEVTTPPQFSARDQQQAMSWVDDAHTHEKQAFFKLIPPQVLSRLRED